MLAISFLGWVMFVRGQSWKSVVGILCIMLGVGVGLAVKANVIVVLPAFFLSGFVLWICSKIEQQKALRVFIVAVFIGFVFLFLGQMISGFGPFSRISLPYYVELAKRYLETAGPHTILATLGPFISPAKNLLFFSPILILIPWVLIKYWRRNLYFTLPALFTVFFSHPSSSLAFRGNVGGHTLLGA